MDLILQLLSIDPALMAKIVPIVLLVLGCLSGVAMILHAVAKVTKIDADDKAVSILDKGLAVLQKIVDFLSGNVKH